MIISRQLFFDLCIHSQVLKIDWRDVSFHNFLLPFTAITICIIPKNSWREHQVFRYHWFSLNGHWIIWIGFAIEILVLRVLISFLNLKKLIFFWLLPSRAWLWNVLVSHHEEIRCSICNFDSMRILARGYLPWLIAWFII